jgi:hypothetical protein
MSTLSGPRACATHELGGRGPAAADGRPRATGRGGGGLWPPEVSAALAILDARRRVHVGMRRCDRRVRRLTEDGAVSGGDRPTDRSLDRALRDRHLLGTMQGDLDLALRRLRRYVGESAIEAMVARVPLAPLQRQVLCDRLSGKSWPRIASERTGGDRGTAARAFRQAVARVQATASVLEALRQDPTASSAALARSTALTVRTVNLIRRRLAELQRSGAAPGSRAPQPVPRRRLRSASEPVVNKPNPGALAELCPRCRADDEAEAVDWRVLEVRPSAELFVKVALEQALGDGVRCRTLRRGRSGALGYLAVACADQRALAAALAGIPGVVGWLGDERTLRVPAAPAPADTRPDAGRLAAAWLDPHRSVP